MDDSKEVFRAGKNGEKGWKKTISNASVIMRKVLADKDLDLSEADRRQYRRNLTRIEGKLSEDRLKIAMIGEFSSGKSTFLNALFREKILKASNRAATSAITEIRHGPDDILVKLVDGQCERYSDEVESVRIDKSFIKFLKERQASDEGAKCIERLTVTLDRRILDNEAVILDTPGFNAGNPDHQALIEKVMSEEADVGVVLFSAQFAAEKGSLEFLKEHGKHIKQFFFIVTKSDLAEDSSEIVKVVENVKKKIRLHFDLESDPDVIPLAPLRALKEQSGPYFEEFCRFERRLLEFANTRKLFIIMGGVVEAVRPIMDKMQVLVDRKNEELDQLFADIDSIKIKDPEKFISNEIMLIGLKLEKEVEGIEDGFKKRLDSIFRKNIEYIGHAIDRIDRRSGLDVKKTIGSEFKALQNDLEKAFQYEVIDKLGETADKIADLFETRFVEHYRRLNHAVRRLDDFPNELRIPRMKFPGFTFQGLQVAGNNLIDGIASMLEDRSALLYKFVNAIGIGFLDKYRMKKINNQLVQSMANAKIDFVNEFEKHLKKAAEQYRTIVIGNRVVHYSRAYTADIEEGIRRLEEEKKKIEEKIVNLENLRANLGLYGNKISEEHKRLKDLEEYVRRIEEHCFAIDAKTWERVDWIVDAAEKFGYLEALRRLTEASLETGDGCVFFNQYLAGCVETRCESDGLAHFTRFFKTLAESCDKREMLGAFEHLAIFDPEALCRTYRSVDFDNSSPSVKNALANACSKAGREEITAEVVCNHYRRLLDEASEKIDELIGRWPEA